MVYDFVTKEPSMTVIISLKFASGDYHSSPAPEQNLGGHMFQYYCVVKTIVTRSLIAHGANFYQHDVGSSFRARIHASVGHMPQLRQGLCRKLVGKKIQLIAFLKGLKMKE